MKIRRLLAEVLRTLLCVWWGICALFAACAAIWFLWELAYTLFYAADRLVSYFIHADDIPYDTRMNAGTALWILILLGSLVGLPAAIAALKERGPREF